MNSITASSIFQILASSEGNAIRTKSSTYTGAFYPKFRVVEACWRPFQGKEASLIHALVHFLVPHGTRFWMPVEGLFENDNWVAILWASIGIEPGFGPWALRQDEPCAWPSWFVNVGLNICFARISCGSSASLESVNADRSLCRCKACRRGADLLVQHPGRGAVACSNIGALEHPPCTCKGNSDHPRRIQCLIRHSFGT